MKTGKGKKKNRGTGRPVTSSLKQLADFGKFQSKKRGERREGGGGESVKLRYP